MLTKHWYLAALAFLLIIVLAGCAPKATPSPAMPTPTSAAAPTVAAPALRPKEAEWAKVVEAAKKEGVVNLYTFSFTGDPGVALSKAFEEKYGIKVGIVGGGGYCAH